MAKEQTQTPESTSSLQDFQFDDSLDFFGIKTTTEKADNPGIKETKGPKINSDEEQEEEDGVTTLDDDESKDKTKPEDDEEDDAFANWGDVEEEEEEEVEQEEETVVEDKKKKPETKAGDKKKPEAADKKEGEEADDQSDKKIFSTLAQEMVEKKIFQNVEIKEGEEIDEDKFFELQDAEIEARVDETFQTFFSELDDDAKAFLKFKKEGGKKLLTFFIFIITGLLTWIISMRKILPMLKGYLNTISPKRKNLRKLILMID